MSPVVALFPLLRHVDPERAHQVALAGLRLGLGGTAPQNDDPTLRVAAFGLEFRNPIGLAAGFDKDAVAVRALIKLGFGFIETGTVTPRPQPGNPKPRLFRLEADRAVINRMGFNNGGLAPYLARLRSVPSGVVPVGANLGINREGADPESDYAAAAAAVAGHVQYIVINVSSPNTPGLRDLQGGSRLRSILHSVDARVTSRPPLLVKIAPDLSEQDLNDVVEVCIETGVKGLIVSNTTTSRPSDLRSPWGVQPGGLSGAPLFALSTAMLARAHRLARGRLELIGVGGVANGMDALTKIQAGARLVQLYTSLTYEGPKLIPRLKSELAEALLRAGFSSIEDAVGTDADRLSGMT